MTNRARTLLLWSPRIAGLAVAAFVSIFALDAFREGTGFVQSVTEFLLHLVPTLAILGVVYIAWRRPWFGALVFFSLAAVYGVTTVDRPSWIITIAGPLTLAGLLYLASWRWLRTDSPL